MNPPPNLLPELTVRDALRALGRLLEYPGSEFHHRLEAAATLFGDSPAAGLRALLQRFSEPMLRLSPEAREELYTATFDVTPSCVAYVSIHLFGEENFKRGEFMAALNARYAQAGFHAEGELPDHLANLLRFAAEAEAPEFRELAEFCLLGPLEKMRRSLDEANPYRPLLDLVRETLLTALPDARPALSPLEQMQQRGVGCAAVSAGCACGPQAAVPAETLETQIPVPQYG